MDVLGQAELITLEAVRKPIALGIVFGLILAAGASFAPRVGDDGKDLGYFLKLKRELAPALGYAVPIALVGYIAGYLTGISRSPAVGSIVPAILALFGGLNIYFFGIENKNRALVGYSIFVFALVFFYGVWGGVVNREVGRVGRLINLSEQERLVKTYRQNRDLPPEPPQWILGTDPR